MQLENLGVLLTETLKHIDLWMYYSYVMPEILITVRIFMGVVLFAGIIQMMFNYLNSESDATKELAESRKKGNELYQEKEELRKKLESVIGKQ